VSCRSLLDEGAVADGDQNQPWFMIGGYIEASRTLIFFIWDWRIWKLVEVKILPFVVNETEMRKENEPFQDTGHNTRYIN
jgi:hypothetical protein